ncbi:hypothetical protein CXB51_031531 [Gossypium anomalum]|uniref:Uncharacterized protein n=1 Tax=Gossypium anomalum TaxID=47600 RepID=A0A8J5YCM3_9ROSI|nr:hypothetical protein CXB51_031531 [Gossypium anomalum]
MVGRPIGNIVVGYENFIIFKNVDIYISYPYHNKSLYVESSINGFPIKSTFIDDESSLNLILYSTLKAVNMM